MTMAETAPIPAPQKILFKRHSLTVRLTHWINVLCISLLLMTGMQIFNAHPHLYWGIYGFEPDTAWLSISAEKADGTLKGITRVGSLSFGTTGLLGLSDTSRGLRQRAFPDWLTVPSYQDLASGRRWHFFFAWLFVLNGLVYFAYGLAAGHFRRALVPSGAELKPGHVLREIADHARLRFPKGEKARHYNALQKLTYLAVIFVLLPVMILSGLTMSPGMDAATPWLVDLFGGRQSARSIHFIAASLITLFILVHLVMVLVSGVWNNMRSMITGRYAIRPEGDAA